ncbi:MAG: hypothetical protein COT89_03225 [Candidatus Colwellbacteria bacterium CG10_big_fil_rev_8_21_14_0_10_42_22]|uniref:Uncharacterized protein n=1 Tax=Candidatus Colwellbacteria bacterium CG10_big_fil_rev_8_21_14_0_10_42_22 TaxID=1974540 RepID=A0A2H0VHJ9_9BACT|nr:MAG: hypothetical protein COT89_03225 [Candidatus Colwellbacteria bacterium CG10_big_fil_rev_8_21_14_0_10_42_22]
MTYVRMAVRPFRKLSDYINKLPLAGKLAIAPVVFRAYTAPKGQRLSRFLMAVALLLVMIVGHYRQVLLGLELYTNGAPWAQSIGLIYAAVNILVVYTQAVILIRVLARIRRLARMRNTTTRRTYKGFSPAHKVACFAVTLGGQIVFLLSQTITGL